MSGETYRRIPTFPQARVIVDNDFAGDPDGLLALAHHLLADGAVVRGITGTAIPREGQPVPAGDTARDAVDELLDRLGVTERPAVSADTRARFAELTEPTDGARLLTVEAMREDDLPLYVCAGGPLTNIASALRADPTLADRMHIVWIGGGSHPDGAWEYNLTHDLPAAQFVFNETRVPIIQVPQAVYRQCAMSTAELEHGLRSAGEFGRWLYSRFTAPPSFVRIAGHWPMGDSPPVLITALTTESSMSRTIPSPWIDDEGRYAMHPSPRDLVVFDTIDVRLLFADFFARLHLAASV
ncbi:nucleoside hydrolase [Microbacterium aurantiacum]|uniref:Nucleoside hydrolase n=1 Tax=Microbacterium aurantiacum TaxID=162393 RepID=A0AAJ2LZ68_9MICO|nr:nucleoside hydrolase [Microbacterium aurantiacum]MDS0245049.1 nucleoside hydrolase [Microbacterium aurantiacum]